MAMKFRAQILGAMLMRVQSMCGRIHHVTRVPCLSYLMCRWGMPHARYSHLVDRSQLCPKSIGDHLAATEDLARQAAKGLCPSCLAITTQLRKHQVHSSCILLATILASAAKGAHPQQCHRRYTQQTRQIRVYKG